MQRERHSQHVDNEADDIVSANEICHVQQRGNVLLTSVSDEGIEIS